MLSRFFSYAIRQKISNESGTVLLWTLGLGVMAIGVLNVSLSLVSLSAQKSELRVLADSIALNSLNRLDFDTFLDSGKLTDIQIDVPLARGMAKSQIQDLIDGVVITRFDAQNENLALTLKKRIELWNFLGYPFSYDLVVSSKARMEVE